MTMTNIEQIQAALKQLTDEDGKKTAERSDAIESALTEIASTLVDLVAIAEAFKTEEPEQDDGNKERARAEAFANTIAEAIRSVRIEAPNIEVKAPSVTVTPTFNVESPVINNEIKTPSVTVTPAPVQIVNDVSPIGTEWDFEITHYGMNSSHIKARKVK
jgi:hypothetical protein